MAIDLGKYLDTSATQIKTGGGINLDKYLPKKITPSVPKPAPKGTVVTKTLPSFLGSGAYAMKIGDPNYKAPTKDASGKDIGHTTYGGFPTKSGYERADIFPVSLSGVNKSSSNITYEPNLKAFNEAQARQDSLPPDERIGYKRAHDIPLTPQDEKDSEALKYRTATDKYLLTEILPKYNSGKMSLREAQVKSVSYLRNEQEGLSKAMKNLNLGGAFGNFTENFEKTANTIGDFLGKSVGNIANKVVKSVQKKIEESKSGQDAYSEQTAKQISEMTGKKVKADPISVKKALNEMSKEQRNLLLAKQNEQVAERFATASTAPVRFTIGAIARDYEMTQDELMNSNEKFIPSSDFEKLIYGPEPIQKITNSEDLYGIIGRNLGVPAAIAAMVLIDLPTLSPKKLAAKYFEDKIAKEGIEKVSKMGADEYIKLIDKAIEAEKASGRITESQVIEATAKAKKTFEDLKAGKKVEVSQAKPVTETKTNGITKIADKELKATKQVSEVKPAIPVKPQEAPAEPLAKKVTKSVPSTKTEQKLASEASKYKTADEFVKAQEDKKTASVFIKSKFSDKTNYVDVPIIRKEDNITLYQGSKIGDKRQFWTPDKKYAERFGKVTERTGSFYKIDNGNKVTDVYIKAPSKSELTDIWNKEQAKVRPAVPTKEGKIEYIPENKPIDKRYKITTERTIGESKLAKSVRERAVENKLASGFEGIPDYEKIKVKDQSKKAIDLIDNNYDLAEKIIKGEAKPPEGLLPESIFVALEEKAIRENSPKIIKLLTLDSPLSVEASLMGQRLRLLAERFKDSPVQAVTDILRTREKQVTRKYGAKTIKDTEKKIATKVSKIVEKSAPKIKEWSDFVESIKC